MGNAGPIVKFPLLYSYAILFSTGHRLAVRGYFGAARNSNRIERRCAARRGVAGLGVDWYRLRQRKEPRHGGHPE